ncbi:MULTISPECIES: hypothetical protein [unclassified Moorena]|nr:MULTISPECIES: hypothetical protein [unclassified Moorena]
MPFFLRFVTWGIGSGESGVGNRESGIGNQSGIGKLIVGWAVAVA